ncbi:hypothetical protein PENSPDRAFT_497664 [Peniophora sp. CONT]|nr:hypothetical protein PENSPDRAFT_497664 [Peniophora sp. CONT]
MSNSSIDPIPLIGPLFIANSLNWMGLGFLLIQVYYYFDNFPSDKIKVRVLVWTLLLLELFQTASTTHHTWVYTVTDWCDNAALLTFPWSAVAVPFTAGLLGWVVQSFYAWRIWVLAPNMIMKAFSVLIFLLSTAQCIVVGAASIIYATNLTSAELAKLGNEFTTWVSISFVADVFIAAGMIIVLRSGRNENLWSKTDNIIKRLTIMTIGTGLLLAVFGMATIVLFVTAEGHASFQYQPGAYTLGKLYSNSAMVTLNARKSFRRTLMGMTGKRTGEDHSLSVSLQFRRSNPNGIEFTGTDLSSNTAQSTGDQRIPVVLDPLDHAETSVNSRNSKSGTV